MTRARVIAAALLVALVLLFAVALSRSPEAPVVPAPPAGTRPAAPPTGGDHPGLLHARVRTVLGATHEGRLRWGRDEEAAWGHFFNGVKAENPWAAFVPEERLPTQTRSIGLFGFELLRRERPLDLDRPFMVRFGDIARLDASPTRVRVTLKSGAVHELDRLEAGDFDDGLRVFDRREGAVDVDSRKLLSVEFLSGEGPATDPGRLHGTVRTAQGEFTGFLRWNREQSLGSDRLDGFGEEGPVGLAFEEIRSIERLPLGGVRVTLRDGGRVRLSGRPEVGEGHRGVHVDDPRLGRVLVSWEAFERVDLGPGGGGPTRDDFPPGRALRGRVLARDGRRLAGRIVFDLDESETTETLDAPAGGVSYTIPFGRIAAIAPGSRDGDAARLAEVTLHDGQTLRLEAAGDLGEGNAGLLVFAADDAPPEYLPWGEVERIELDEPGSQGMPSRRLSSGS